MTASSSSSPSRPDAPVAVVACGALAGAIRAVAADRGWDVEVRSVSALLHNHPARIPAAVAAMADRLQEEGRRVAVAYADCGTSGALDALGLPRLPGLHCYDLLAGPERVRALLEEEPGTYLLTDFLVASFTRTVVAQLGLDRHPELAADYFRHYRRVVWLSERPTPALAGQAAAAASVLGLPLETVVVGRARLEAALARLLAD